MYAEVRVKIPEEKGKVTRKKIKGTTYIYYQLDRVYNAEKKYTIPKSTPIGKCCDDDPSLMHFVSPRRTGIREKHSDESARHFQRVRTPG